MFNFSSVTAFIGPLGGSRELFGELEVLVSADLRPSGKVKPSSTVCCAARNNLPYPSYKVDIALIPFIVL
jgi:hypothetical protein